MLSHMNANVIAPKAHHRLEHIKKMSRWLKLVFLLYFAVVGLVLIFGHVKTPIRLGDQSYGSLAEVPALLTVCTALQSALFLLAAIAFYRLLGLYEKGIIFSAENVAEIRRLGKLAIFNGVVSGLIKVGLTFPILPMEILFSPWFIVGCLTLIIARIMDEGRKMQEEQELTV